MTDNVKIVRQDNNVKVTEVVNKVTFASVGIQGPKGSEIYTADGVPSITIGTIGDYYIDNNTKNFYGPKTDAGWGNVKFIMGGNSLLAGTTDPSSSIGAVGDVYINTTTNQLFKKGSSGWNNGQVLINPANFSYVHEQQALSGIWNIHHGLHYRPSVTVTDYGRNNIECDITHIDADNVELDFNLAVSGYAYLS